MHVILALLALADGTIVTADNQQILAREISIVDVAGVLTIQYTDAQNRPQAIKCEEVVEVVFARVHPPRKFAVEDVMVTTTTGDALYGAVAGPNAKKDGVRLTSRAFGEVELMFDHVSTVRFLNNRPHWPKKDPVVGRRDLLVLKTGDQPEGDINVIDKGSVEYRSRVTNKNTTIPLENISLIFLRPPVAKPPKPPVTLHAIVSSTDGSSFQGTLAELKGGVLSFTNLYGREMKISAASLASLHFKNGKVVYVSDLTPTLVDENANFIRPVGGKALPSDLTYPWQADKSAAGTKLSVRGKEFRKGIGVRARSSLTYDLDKKFRRMQASIGIDDCLEHGDVVFEVWVDGALKLKQPMKSGDAAFEIDVDVSGARTLRLFVDFGGNANIGDFADWGSARLIK